MSHVESDRYAFFWSKMLLQSDAMYGREALGFYKTLRSQAARRQQALGVLKFAVLAIIAFAVGGGHRRICINITGHDILCIPADQQTAAQLPYTAVRFSHVHRDRTLTTLPISRCDLRATVSHLATSARPADVVRRICMCGCQPHQAIAQ